MLRTCLVYLAFASVILSTPYSRAATPTDAPVSVFDGVATFVPPAGFTRPSEEIVRRKFPNATEPAVFYSNERATTSVAVSYHMGQQLTPEQLPEFRPAMASFLETQQPGLQWLKNEMIEINGTKWVHYEFITRAVDARIHNDIYLTSVDQRMLLFNFNSANHEYSKYREALAASVSSIRVKPKKK